MKILNRDDWEHFLNYYFGGQMSQECYECSGKNSDGCSYHLKILFPSQTKGLAPGKKIIRDFIFLHILVFTRKPIRQTWDAHNFSRFW